MTATNERAQADRALWRAVISQAIGDVMLAGTPPADRQRAIAWLSSNGADFRHVCALADLEPQRVREFAAAHIARAKTEPKRKAKRLTIVSFDGEQIPLRDLADRFGINISTIQQRLRRGIALRDALTMKHRQRLTGGRSRLSSDLQGPAGVHPHKIAPNSGFSA